MAYNVLEYLKAGKVDFVYRETPYDREHTIACVRKAIDKNDIINGFLPKLLSTDPLFCFAVIYDNDAFELQTRKLLAKGYKLTEEMLINLLKNTSWGKDYIYDNIEDLENTISEETYSALFKIFIENPSKYYKFIGYYKAHPNTHIRFLFMKFLLEKHEELFDIVYPDLMSYLTSVTYQENEQLTLFPDYMANEDICNLAFLIFKSKYRNQYFSRLKEYILKHYPENDLVKVLISPLMVPDTGSMFTIEKNEEGIAEFSKDADRLFLTSSTYKFHIIKNYPSLISKEILEQFLSYYSRFRDEDSNIIGTINYCRLGNTLLEFIDKYLSLSKNPTWRYLDDGSTSVVYLMGDYVLKLFRTKWSYEDVICPDLYLIVKNLEEIYLRKTNGIIKCGIEVQPYLARSAKGVSKETLKCFKEELARLGYRSTDTFMNGKRGDNCRLLDSYKDADCKNPEKLPDWFKEMPLVLVDRDRIYPKDQIYIRQLSNGY